MKWPQGWREVLLSDVIESAQPGFAQRPGEENEGSTAQIRTHNVSPDGRIALEGIKHVTVAEGDLERYRLLPGDVVFNNTNSEEWVGKTAVFDQHDGVFVYSNHMTRIRVRQDVLLPEFLAAYLHFLWSAGYSRNRAKRWVSQAAIDAPTLLKFKLPLPPLPEQQRIVDVLRTADLRPLYEAASKADLLRETAVRTALVCLSLTSTVKSERSQTRPCSLSRAWALEPVTEYRTHGRRAGLPETRTVTRAGPAECACTSMGSEDHVCSFLSNGRH